MSDNVKPWDLLNPFEPRSQEELSTYRLEICSTCEHFRSSTKQCKKCGCFMKLKTHLENASCPLGKWWHMRQYVFLKNLKNFLFSNLAKIWIFCLFVRYTFQTTCQVNIVCTQCDVSHIKTIRTYRIRPLTFPLTYETIIPEKRIEELGEPSK